MGEKFNEKEFFESEWTGESKVHLNYESDDETATGIITTLWGNLYMHIDYAISGFHFSEKFMVSENSDTNTADIHIVAGPYPKDFETEKSVWEKWLQEVKRTSEGK